MFFPGDQPDALELLLLRQRELMSNLQQALRTLQGEVLDILPEADCAPWFPATGVVVVLRGQMDIILNGKTSLVLETGDLFICAEGHGAGPLTCQSEEPGKLLMANAKGLRRWLEQPEHAEAFHRLLMLQHLILTTAQAHGNRLGTRPTAGFERLPAGTCLLVRGSSADMVYTLLRGKARVEVDGVPLGSVHEGEIFGALAALTGEPRNADVVALTDVTVMSVPADQFLDLIRFQPETFMRLLQTLARQVNELNQTVLSLSPRPSFPPAGLRLVENRPKPAAPEAGVPE